MPDKSACMSPALNGSTELQRFERSNAVEIRNGIMLDFYPDCHICKDVDTPVSIYTSPSNYPYSSPDQLPVAEMHTR